LPEENALAPRVFAAIGKVFGKIFGKIFRKKKHSGSVPSSPSPTGTHSNKRAEVEFRELPSPPYAQRRAESLESHGQGLQPTRVIETREPAIDERSPEDGKVKPLGGRGNGEPADSGHNSYPRNGGHDSY
jgi:hypothetical protein